MESLALAIASIAVVLWLGNALALSAEAARFEPVRSRRIGPLAIELRRRVQVSGHDNGRGGIAFAQCHETRLRLYRVFGLPVWRAASSIELPAQVMGMTASLTARDFDSEFDDAFREADFAHRERPQPTQWPIGWSKH
ncbi:MAG: hypothetical protein OEY03_17015 [Rhizobacter sp.]|nr:hypothetical protein [Rhizobacter sp.]